MHQLHQPPESANMPNQAPDDLAIVIHAAKDLRVEAVPAAAKPGKGEVLVAMEVGGICGSDLHYYSHGGFGAIRLREPMILGHEVAGRIAALGPGVDSLAVGDPVAVSPSRPCAVCRFCQRGAQQHCLNMRFYGSAMPFPHIQGAFRRQLVADASQCHKLPAGMTMAEGAMAEPLAVCLHAGRRAGPLLGRRVLITGAGPIGQLMVVVARRAGAAEIVVTDVTETPLKLAKAQGADATVDVAADGGAMTPYAKDKGAFDVLFEASGNEAALVGAFDMLRPGAVIVQLGLGGTFTLPINTIVAKEFELRGTFRFHEEFALAVQLMGAGLIRTLPLVTATMPFTQAKAAFDLAADKSRSVKVQLSFV
jgi:L-idonate 5-dehydrogenase